ncbi:TRAP transporter large permease subunit [Oceanimonas sp. NS1]|nr:TRAP transporter large permease subunit [Oceanimonas sp. NS1]
MKDVLRSLETTTWLTGRVLLILFTATVFGRLLVENQIPAIVAASMLELTTNIYLIWALIIFFLLFVGMFMETLAAILILTPVLLPVGYSLGIDPVHFGIVVVCCLSIGFQTPPLGENLFIARGYRAAPLRRFPAGPALCPDLGAGGVHYRLHTGDHPVPAQIARVLARVTNAAGVIGIKARSRRRHHDQLLDRPAG